MILTLMLTLLMLRHAKSSWDDHDLEDFERPLTKRGTKAAGAMGRYIAENDLVPEQAMCSDAVRTRETFGLVASELGGAAIETSFRSELYLASPKELLDHARGAGDSTSRLLLIGHNPGLHAASLALVGRGEAQRLRAMRIKFPTAALAVITFRVSKWAEIGPAGGTLSVFKTPRELD